MLHQPSVTKAHHRKDANTRRSTTKSNPHPPKPPRPSGETIVGPTTAIATHTHTQPRRTIVPKRVATPLAPGCEPGPDIATVWACPTPVYIHTASPGTNNTHTHTQSQGHRAVCPSSTHMSIRKCDRTTPSRNAATAAQTHWCQSTMWRGHTRSTTSPKKGKRKGGISKEFYAKTNLCPLASPRVALVGVCLLRHPDNGNTR